jgi:ATP synthase, Delta/Epsilon chain, beta-sandwich domain
MSDQSAGVEQQQVIGKPTTPASQTEREERQAVSDFSKTQDKQLSMHVKVYSPFRTYYDGPAFSISAENVTGPFDILPRHHSFISLLLSCDLIVRTISKGDQKIRISGGIMHVKADQVIVFLDV